jgi:AcrR family transcriptional regulator
MILSILMVEGIFGFEQPLPITMPTDSPRRATARPKPTTTSTPAASAPGVEARGARRKRETRTRLLEAALKLMAEKGMEGVAINEITEAADVGFGSFYNHFESKEAIHAALTDWVFEEFADTLDRVAGALADPAEVIAVSVRHTLLRAKHDPVWSQFLIREGLSARALSRGLGQRLIRDISKGVMAGRFIVDDLLMCFASVGGTVLAAIALQLQFESLQEFESHPMLSLDTDSGHLGERTAAALLQTLGIAKAEALEIANRPLPAVDS